MDFSKLPKLSNTKQAADLTDEPASAGGDHPATQPSAPAGRNAFCFQCGAPIRPLARFCDSCGTPLHSRAVGSDPGAGPEAWISIGLGILLLLLFPNLIKFLFHPGTTAFDATDTATGAVIPYVKSAFLWPDIGVTLFAVVLLVDGLIVLLARRVTFVTIALGLSVIATVLNLWVVVRSFNVIGLQFACALAALFGGYISFCQWALLRHLRSRKAGA